VIVVHHLNSSRSWRVLWLLQELGVPYQVKAYQRDPRTYRAPPSLRQVHPLGKAPVIMDDRCILAETGAIVEYVTERYGGGRLAPPAGSQDRLRYMYWLHYAEGSAMPPLLLSLVFSEMPKAPMPFFIRPIVRGIAAKAQETFIGPMLKEHLDFMEGELGKTTWFAGEEFSAADIIMSFPVEGFAARGGLDASRPKLWAWLERIRSRPAYQRVVENVGPLGIVG
jgi:glutathione S-transferase